jgi:hypothetical protein
VAAHGSSSHIGTANARAFRSGTDCSTSEVLPIGPRYRCPLKNLAHCIRIRSEPPPFLVGHHVSLRPTLPGTSCPRQDISEHNISNTPRKAQYTEQKITITIKICNESHKNYERFFTRYRPSYHVRFRCRFSNSMIYRYPLDTIEFTRCHFFGVQWAPGAASAFPVDYGIELPGLINVCPNDFRIPESRF